MRGACGGIMCLCGGTMGHHGQGGVPCVTMSGTLSVTMGDHVQCWQNTRILEETVVNTRILARPS